MRRYLPVLAGLLLLAGIATPAAAQERDSIWVVEWKRTTKTPSGYEHGDTYTIWLDGDNMLLKIPNDRYASLIGDSLYMIDTFHTLYSSGPADLVEMTWLREKLIRHRGTAQPLKIIQTGIRTQEKGYDVEEWIVLRTLNNKFIPVEERLLVTNQLPLPDSLLENLYLAKSMVEAGFALDRVKVYDTLLKNRMIPLKGVWHITITSDSNFYYTTELTDIRKTVVPDDFFLPPPDYKYEKAPIPSTEILWMYKMIPMPGGPRKK